MSPSPSIHKRAEGWGVSVRKRAYPWKVSVHKRTRTLLTTGLMPMHPVPAHAAPRACAPGACPCSAPFPRVPVQRPVSARAPGAHASPRVHVQAAPGMCPCGGPGCWPMQCAPRAGHCFKAKSPPSPAPGASRYWYMVVHAHLFPRAGG